MERNRRLPHGICQYPTIFPLSLHTVDFFLENRGWNIFGAPCIIAKDGCAIMPEGNVFPWQRSLYLSAVFSHSMQTIWYTIFLEHYDEERIFRILSQLPCERVPRCEPSHSALPAIHLQKILSVFFRPLKEALI